METFNDQPIACGLAIRQPMRSKPCRPCNGERRETVKGSLFFRNRVPPRT